MALETPLYVEPITVAATQLRRIIQALYPVDGTIGLNDFIVQQRAAGANMTVDVAAGQAVISGTTSANQGKYLVTSTATANIAVSAAPGSGTRTDLVVLQVYDNEADGSGLMSWTPLVVTNPTVGTGTPPATPANAYPVASIAVAAGVGSIVNANITMLAGQALPGGIPTIQRGTFSMSFTAGIATGTVTFPAGFRGTPSLQLTCQAITNNTTTVLNQTGVTSSGFTYRAAPASGSTAYTGSGFAEWVAVY
jgi:hypothetical protein